MSKKNAQNSKNTSKKQKDTNGNQPSRNQWYEIDYLLVEEVAIGDTKLRLVQNPNNKSKYIQLWSSLSNQWNIAYRYDVDEQWNKWKKYADIHSERRKQRDGARNDLLVERPRKSTKRKSKSKASVKRTENSFQCIREPRFKSA